MNKQSIVEAVHEKLGGTKVAAEQAVETMIETITGALKKGEAIKVAAMRVPKFRPAKALKDAVKE